MTNSNFKTVEDRIKLYLAPLLVVIFGGFFNANLMEMKSDIKILLSHDNAQIEQIKSMDKQIEDLKSQIKELQNSVHTLELARLKTIGYYEMTKPKVLVKTAIGYKYES